MAQPPRPPRKVLVISTNMLGDTLLMTPVIRSLRSAWPACSIDLLLCRASPEVVEGNPDIDQVIQVARRPGWRENWQLFRRIALRYEMVISHQTSDRVMIYSLFAARFRVGRLPDSQGISCWWRKRLLSRYMVKDHNEAIMLQNSRLIRLLGLPEQREVIPPEAPLPAAADLPLLLPLSLSSRPLVIVHPFGSNSLKSWPRHHWCQLLDWLSDQGLQPLLSGGPGSDERQAVAEIAAGCQQPVIDLCGRLRLGQWTGLLRQARLYIGVDTSMTHLAAACGTPSVALFARTPPSRWGPWPKGYSGSHSPFSAYGPLQQQGNVITLQGELPCVPCGAKFCLENNSMHPRCMAQLPPARVTEAALRLLQVAAPQHAESPQAEPEQAR